MADFWSVMSESLSRCGLRSLAVEVSELLNRVAKEVLALLETRGGRTLSRLLRLLLSERLTTATERIVGLLERELEEYRRQLERQRRLLDAVLSPVVRLGRTGKNVRKTDDDGVTNMNSEFFCNDTVQESMSGTLTYLT